MDSLKEARTRLAIGAAAVIVIAVGYHLWQSLQPLAPSNLVVIEVKGAVRKAGKYSLAPRSTWADAVDRAGGFTAKANPEGIELGRLIAAGDVITVPTAGPSKPSVSPPKPPSAELLDALNRWDAEALRERLGLNKRDAAQILILRSREPIQSLSDLEQLALSPKAKKALGLP